MNGLRDKLFSRPAPPGYENVAPRVRDPLYKREDILHRLAFPDDIGEGVLVFDFLAE